MLPPPKPPKLAIPSSILVALASACSLNEVVGSLLAPLGWKVRSAGVILDANMEASVADLALSCEANPWDAEPWVW